jgi:hypothetical protein
MKGALMDATIIPVTGILVPIVLVPTILAMKHARRKREYEHLERMKALEMGHRLPQAHAWSAVAATAIGAGVPIAALFFAWLASVTTHASEDIWIGASFVGISGVVGGATLGWLLLGKQRDVNEPTPDRYSTAMNGKQPVDPDAFDVAGQRG